MAAARPGAAGLRSRLPWIDPKTAALRNRALALLSAVRLDGEEAGLRLLAETTADPEPSTWLLFGTGYGALAMAPERVNGRPALWLQQAAAPDLPEALAEMSRLEPLIAALERSSGLALEPQGLGPASGPSVRAAAVDGGGDVVHQVRIGVGASLIARWPARVVDLTRLGAVTRARVDGRLTIDGPVARASEIATLSVGDLLLLPRSLGGLWSGRLDFQGRPGALRGVADLSHVRFTVLEETAPMLDPEFDATVLPPDPVEDSAGQPSAVIADWPLRLRVVLAELRLSVGEVAGLRPGSVVALPGAGEELLVEVLADDTPIATGRLVALGEAFGVLIDRLAAEPGAGGGQT